MFIIRNTFRNARITQHEYTYLWLFQRGQKQEVFARGCYKLSGRLYPEFCLCLVSLIVTQCYRACLLKKKPYKASLYVMFDFQWTKAISNYYRNQPSWTVQKFQSIFENNNADPNLNPCDSQFQSYISTGDRVKNLENLSEELGLILSISGTDTMVHLLWTTLSWAKWVWWYG